MDGSLRLTRLTSLDVRGIMESLLDSLIQVKDIGGVRIVSTPLIRGTYLVSDTQTIKISD